MRATHFASAALFAALVCAGCSSNEAEPSSSAAQASPKLPLVWHLGNVDPRFQIGANDIRACVERAAALWNDASGKQLFLYDDARGFPIDFVFNSTEETFLAKEALKRQLDSVKASLQATKEKETRIANEYDAEGERVKAAAVAFNARVASFNREVEAWNASGGAPPDQVEALNTEKQAINMQKAQLDQSEQQLQNFRDAANASLEEYNTQIQRYNGAVRTYNARYGPGHPLTVGQCVLKGAAVEHIAVFAFRDQSDLTLTLAHELGHALGLPHVPGEGSVMSAVENGEAGADRLELTPADKRELLATLTKKTGLSAPNRASR